MKKALTVLISICLVAAMFAACASKTPAGNSKSEESFPNGGIAKATSMTTDQAKIVDKDAINLIKSYSAKELSLTDEEMKKCDFLVAASGVEVNGDNYIQVIAAVKNVHEEDGKTSFTFDNKGEYYIRYDGKQILKKDMTKDKPEYTEMDVKEIPEEKEAEE